MGKHVHVAPEFPPRRPDTVVDNVLDGAGDVVAAVTYGALFSTFAVLMALSHLVDAVTGIVRRTGARWSTLE